MASATGIARDKQSLTRSKVVKSTEVTTLGAYSRVVITFEDGSRLFTYGSSEQTKLV
jgi:hypothetical protein